MPVLRPLSRRVSLSLGASAHCYAGDDGALWRCRASAYRRAACFLYSVGKHGCCERCGCCGRGAGTRLGHVGTDGAERTRIVEAKLPCEPCADTSWGIVEACVGRVDGHSGLNGADNDLLLRGGAGNLFESVEQGGWCDTIRLHPRATASSTRSGVTSTQSSMPVHSLEASPSWRPELS